MPAFLVENGEPPKELQNLLDLVGHATSQTVENSAQSLCLVDDSGASISDLLLWSCTRNYVGLTLAALI